MNDACLAHGMPAGKSSEKRSRSTPNIPLSTKSGSRWRKSSINHQLALRRRDHQTCEDSALGTDQFPDASAPQREHFVQLRLGECRFLTRALQFDEFAVFGSRKIKINGDQFVLFVIQVSDCLIIQNAGADCRA